MFRGLGTALITPFTDEGEVDYEALRKLIHYQIEHGTDSLIVLGTTGEAPSILEPERAKIVEIAIREANHRIPVIIGTGSNCLDSVLKYNRMAEEMNADGVLIVTPYYNKGTQESIFQYYRHIAERTRLPIIVYNVPTRTGFNLLPDTMFRIFKACSNIVGIKEANADFGQLTKLMAGRPEGMLVFSGNDDITLPFMALGAEGVISVVGNIIPAEMKTLTTHMLAGDLDGARNIHDRYLELINAMFVEVNPIPVKFAASRLNLCRNVLRLPLIPLSEKNAQVVASLMQAQGLL
ncbi:MAG: 4-hydroxy-tetrahydrodipicolinate synthase [Candidatus Marinimicrobia bacterium]|jgi:4-hydroxy-tetrahydrodipicolinate synthase|nr:4-hydroxy-tetrahydrodipicolinate synthase [Candidatus Neomarinimicrobiota bacterium]MCK9559891.1 4-hydroxy-tetrahydrodipicolinate synthase [Candidatus Neomarinimicrobiota bacterium]